MHGGVSLGWYSDLEAGYDSYDPNDSTTANNFYNRGSSNDVPMAKRFGYSWFAGVSYNLTKKKEIAPTP